jgi:hypothetical protein
MRSMGLGIPGRRDGRNGKDGRYAKGRRDGILPAFVGVAVGYFLVGVGWFFGGRPPSLPFSRLAAAFLAVLILPKATAAGFFGLVVIVL